MILVGPYNKVVLLVTKIQREKMELVRLVLKEGIVTEPRIILQRRPSNMAALKNLLCPCPLASYNVT